MSQETKSEPRFARSEKVRGRVWTAADGRCAMCGADLGPGWHADHVSDLQTEAAYAEALAKYAPRVREQMMQQVAR